MMKKFPIHYDEHSDMFGYVPICSEIPGAFRYLVGATLDQQILL